MQYPELITEGKVFPFPYSVYQSLITEQIDFDSATEMQAYAFAYGTRIDLTGRANRQTWVIRPPDDYHYHLEGVRVFYPRDAQNLVTLDLAVVLEQRSRDVVNDPMPVPIYTTPGNFDRRLYMVRANTLIPANSQCKIEISGNNGTVPEYVDLMTEGLRIPVMGGGQWR